MSVLLDGNAARLVDLSEVGAQVVSSTVLKPNQRVRVALTDDHGALRFNAAVAWASFEIAAQARSAVSRGRQLRGRGRERRRRVLHPSQAILICP